jgi:hypothetical protein
MQTFGIEFNDTWSQSEILLLYKCLAATLINHNIYVAPCCGLGPCTTKLVLPTIRRRLFEHQQK